MKKLILEIISENQGGFVPKRQIIDNVIIVQEAIHSNIQRKERGMIVKLDMANAFDRVNHKFLAIALKKFGFSINFIEIIQACISNPWIAPLINGWPSKFFQSTRGLRQCCPLSPFLYIIAAESLSAMMEKQRKEKKITGIQISRGVKDIKHSLFVDDILPIGGASSIKARRFKKVLDEFLLASGGILNNSKCIIYCWNTSTKTMQCISQIMEIPLQINWSHFTYLRRPLAKEVVK